MPTCVLKSKLTPGQKVSYFQVSLLLNVVMSTKIVPNVLRKTTFSKYVYNRNPRNLEKLCIAYKPDGWHLEAPGRRYWHRLFIDRTSRNIIAYIKHYTGHIPVKASTKEWAIRKHLYSGVDRSAYFNLARVFAHRCNQTGITEVYSDIQPSEIEKGSKSNLQIFIDELITNGITLKEADRYINPRPSDLQRPDKAWEYH